MSLAIFALAAVVLGAAYVNVLVNYHQLEQQDTDRTEIALARAELLGEPDRGKAERGGELPLATGAMLRWRPKIGETTVADLFKVDLEWEIPTGGRAGPRREHESFLLLRPTWSEADKRAQLRAAAKARLDKRKY